MSDGGSYILGGQSECQETINAGPWQTLHASYLTAVTARDTTKMTTMTGGLVLPSLKVSQYATEISGMRNAVRTWITVTELLSVFLGYPS
ncbi:hypothetical protein J6590_077817 [Homalodisca vitripennis]|nr:hypothetical protein J6590_077817 [Homalodisca vitripennis]